MTTTNQALIAAQRAINSMKNEAETAAQGDEQMMLEACEEISKQGLAADTAIRAALDTPDQAGEGEPRMQRTISRLQKQITDLKASRDHFRRLAAPAAAVTEGASEFKPTGECDSPELCRANRACCGQYDTKKLCAAPAAAVPASLTDERLLRALKKIAHSCDIDTLGAAIDCAREAIAATSSAAQGEKFDHP